jgi:hypothetical protein
MREDFGLCAPTVLVDDRTAVFDCSYFRFWPKAAATLMTAIA